MSVDKAQHKRKGALISFKASTQLKRQRQRQCDNHTDTDTDTDTDTETHPQRQKYAKCKQQQAAATFVRLHCRRMVPRSLYCIKSTTISHGVFSTHVPMSCIHTKTQTQTHVHTQAQTHAQTWMGTVSKDSSTQWKREGRCAGESDAS